jgi:hypothetical protein
VREVELAEEAGVDVELPAAVGLAVGVYSEEAEAAAELEPHPVRPRIGHLRIGHAQEHHPELRAARVGGVVRVEAIGREEPDTRGDGRGGEKQKGAGGQRGSEGLERHGRRRL